eukprot:COSAG01_NODE_123_length_25210_cov_348.799434_2_plen_414_part_00
MARRTRSRTAAAAKRAAKRNSRPTRRQPRRAAAAAAAACPAAPAEDPETLMHDDINREEDGNDAASHVTRRHSTVGWDVPYDEDNPVDEADEDAEDEAPARRTRSRRKQSTASGTASQKSKKSSSRRRGRHQPKTPRDAQPPTKARGGTHVSKKGQGAKAEQCAAGGGDRAAKRVQTSVDDVEDEEAAKLDPLSRLPEDIRAHIFSYVTTDAETWARYRTVSTLFADFSDVVTRRFVVNGKLRLAMYRQKHRGINPSSMFWDLVSRWADTLEHLDLHEMGELTNLSGLKDFRQLKSLNLSGCFGLKSLEGIGRCQALESVNLSCCSGLSDIDALGSCTRLQTIDVGYCLGLDDISAIDQLEELVTLKIPRRLEEQTNVAVTREDEHGMPGALKVELVGGEEQPEAERNPYMYY